MAHCTGKRKKASTQVKSYALKGKQKRLPPALKAKILKSKGKSPVKGHKCPSCPHPAKCKKAGKCLKHGRKTNARKKKK